MFVNSQDTTLLHDALISAVNWINSNEESNPKRSFDLKDRNGVVDIVMSTIIGLTRDTSKVKTEMELLERQLCLNRRLHATIFFKALRSHGITCSEANDYYASILHTFPSMDWKFYLKLNYYCNWSEYFIECARQLQPDILAAVIKALLSIPNQEDFLKYYMWHLALQSLIWKFFHLEDPSIVHSQEDCSFEFPFADPHSTSESNKMAYDVVHSDNPGRSKLLHAYITLLNHLLKSSKSSLEDFHFIKIILHCYKTVFKLLSKISVYNGENIKDLFRLNVLLKQCITTEVSRSAIESALNSPETFLLDHCYVTTSWEIEPNYLVFLLCNYWKDVLQLMLNDSEVCFSSVSSLLPPKEEKETLVKLCPLFTRNFKTGNEHNIQLLKTILHYDYPCASRAAGILLVHPEVRSTTDILNTLEEHASKLSPFETYPLIANAIVEADFEEIKMKFLTLFYQNLSQGSIGLYNDALKYILDNYGINKHFILPDFDSQLVQFTRKTMLLEKAEKYLLPLFLQSPQVVLKTLIEQALIRGAEGVAIIPILIHIPSVCQHKDNFPLIEELSYYFLKDDLETYEAKNIVNLTETVMEVLAEKEIASFDKFLEQCILPNFSQDRSKRLDLTLECLNVSLKVLINKDALNISTEPFLLLVECLASIIDACIKSGNGRRKELTLLTLTFLSTYEKLAEKISGADLMLLKPLCSLGGVVQVYLIPFLGQSAYEDFLSMSYLYEPLWTYCCYYKDEKLFKERFPYTRINYEQLLGLLIPLLSHFTKEEWVQSADLLKDYIQRISPRTFLSNFPSLLPKSDPLLYAVIRTLMDCFCFILKLNSCDVHYVTNCFTKTVMGILNQETHPQLFLNVFLDTCHIASISDMDILPLLSSFLMSIKKSICLACEDKLVEKNYLKLTSLSARCLPDSDAKTSLLQKFQ